VDTIDIIGYILIGGAMLVAALRLQDQDDNDGDNSDDGPGGGMMIPVGGAA
jgi:hypothetical protein